VLTFPEALVRLWNLIFEVLNMAKFHLILIHYFL